MNGDSGGKVYGGLLRYYDDYKSKLVLKPVHIVIMAVILICVVIGLHVTAPIQ